MEVRYKVKYEENQKVLTGICKIFHLAQKRTTFRIVVACGGLIVLAFMMYYGDRGGGTPGGFLILMIKFALWWLIAFFIGDILAQTIGRRLEESTSLVDGEDMYKRRMRNRKTPPAVCVEFYDDHVVNNIDGIKKEYTYDKIRRLVESNDTLGIILIRDDGKKGLYGFPIDGIVKADPEELKEFIAGKCPQVKK